jgi:transcriptional regulator with XRE-family HTH domain
VPGPNGETLSKYVAANVRRVRERLGLSQQEFADQVFAGDVRRLQRLEGGRYDIRLSTLALLAAHLKVHAGALLRKATFQPRQAGRPRRTT